MLYATFSTCTSSAGAPMKAEFAARSLEGLWRQVKKARRGDATTAQVFDRQGFCRGWVSTETYRTA